MLRREFMKLLGGVPLMGFPQAPTSIGFRNQPLQQLAAGNVILNKQGLFVYDGTPAFGNLIFSSISSAAGQTDKFSNKLIPNTTMYTGGSTAIQFVGGTEQWWNGSFGAGWNGVGIFVTQNGFGSPALNVSGGPLNLSTSLVIASSSNPTRHGTGLAEFQGDIFSWAASVGTVLHSLVSGDTNDRFLVDSNGRMHWGTGAAATDTDLYRVASAILQTDGAIQMQAGAAGNGALAAFVFGDLANRWNMDSNGKMQWGDGTHAVDTNLYRVSAGVLKTDQNLNVAFNINCGTLFAAGKILAGGANGSTGAAEMESEVLTGGIGLGIFESGDTAYRCELLETGIAMGNGGVAPDTTFLRNGAASASLNGMMNVLDLAVGESNQGALAANGTINTYTTTAKGMTRVAPAAAVTGIIMQAGTIAGQEYWVCNDSANLITFAAAGSNVSGGSAITIPAHKAGKFVWSAVAALWFQG